MGVYKIPLRLAEGEFRYGELPKRKVGECLELDYDTEYETMDYEVPIYGNEARIYTVPRRLMPGALTARYGRDGALDAVRFDDNGCLRLFYIRYKNIAASERGVLKFVRERADMIAKEIKGQKRTLARLFVEYFYDGEAVDIAAKPADAEDMREVVEYYKGDITSADNCGNYPHDDRLEVGNEELGVMLTCTSGDLRSMLFYKAAETFTERLRSRTDKINKTEDFKFIAEEYD